MVRRRILVGVTGAVVAATLLGGCGLLRKKTKTTGIPECDLYIAEYECFIKKSAGDAAASHAAEALADSFSKAGAGAGAGAVAQSCTAQRTAMAEQLKAQGCLLGPAPTTATTATAATTVDASAPAVVKASTPPAPASGRGKNGGACSKTADCVKGLRCVAHGGLKTCEDADMKNGCPQAEDFGTFEATTVDGEIKALVYCGTCPAGTTKAPGNNGNSICKPGASPPVDAGAPAPSKLSPLEAACDGKKGRDPCTFNGKPGVCRSALVGGGDVKLLCALN